MEKSKTVGNRQYRVLISQSDGAWYAKVSPVPPPDGRVYAVPLWMCKAASEDELEEKLNRHFDELLAAQKTKN